ncbi:MAG TPA: cytochrome c3 family protein [Thermoleophilia bacterium]|nr:cytochrome c3 family protein [Thermoleophilia bacterium]
MRAVPQFILAALLLLASAAHAGVVERLMMPGDVGRAHADIEADCGKCHQAFDRSSQRTLCLECHDEVELDLERDTGYHGRAPIGADQACNTCHHEHRGRDGDVLGLDRDTFDHDVTDHPLVGRHESVTCEACHVPDTPHREAPGACNDCHRDDDPHRGTLGQTCGDCHTPDGWQNGRFDHATTGLVLEGEHRQAACASCHPAERYENTPTDCVSCHRAEDVHRGGFGSQCGDCHSPAGWKTGFDHDRDTKFQLHGTHRGLECRSCHASDPRSETLAGTCVSCHQADDAHRGRLGPGCDDCHGSVSWSPASFDHGRDTDFQLQGAHQRADCQTCHLQPPREKKLGEDCYACHRTDDVHEGQQGTACGRCHGSDSWEGKVFFDHEITRFPLLGVHAIASCEQCHASMPFKAAEQDCVGCHADVDAHQGRLGPRCQDCHNPNAWKLWDFDHGTRTRFALRGAHTDLECRACHQRPVHSGVELERDCYGCHERDDTHRGAFGRECERCHTEVKWRGAERLR